MSDDLAYAQFAHEIASGTFYLTAGVFQNRLGLLLPVAGAIALFGSNAFSLLLVPALASTALVFWCGLNATQLAGKRAGVFAAIIAANSYHLLKHAGLLYPETLLALSLATPAFVLSTLHSDSPRLRQVSLSLLVATLLLLGFAAKATAIWIAPFLLIEMILDLRSGNRKPFWIGLICSGTVLMGLYLFSYWVLNGDALLRFHAIEKLHNTSVWSFGHGPAQSLLARVTYEPVLLILTSFSLAPLTGLALCALPHEIQPVQQEGSSVRSLVWFRWLAGLLAGAWWCSSSLHRYAPVPLYDRYWTVFVPGLAILAGLALAWLSQSTERTWFWKISIPFFALAATAALSTGAFNTALLLAGFAFLSATTTPWTRKMLGESLPQYTVPMFFVALASTPLIAFLQGHLGRGQEQKTEIHIVDFIRAQDDGLLATIWTDPRSKIGLPYYWGFELPRNLEIEEWDFHSIDRSPEPKRRTFVYLNRPRQDFLRDTYGTELPGMTFPVPWNWKRVAGLEPIVLYEVQ